jgi:hypothetical protein
MFVSHTRNCRPDHYGDYDFHPDEGAQKPLAGVTGEFRGILPENRGHLPWIETAASDRFYATLMEELRYGKSRTD